MESMDALSNADFKYQKQEGYHWFVIRSTFNRARKAYDLLTLSGFTAYMPVHVVERVKNKRLRRVVEPLIHNMLFVYANEADIKDFVKLNKEISYVTLYYNHFETNAQGYNTLMKVPEAQMDNFIRATRMDNKHVLLVDPTNIRYKTGDTVRVIEGDFLGVTGKVARVRGQSRVVVTLDGVCAIATAYIPQAFLEPYEPG